MVFTFGTLWCPLGQIDPGHIWGFKNNSNILYLSQFQTTEITYMFNEHNQSQLEYNEQWKHDYSFCLFVII